MQIFFLMEIGFLSISVGFKPHGICNQKFNSGGYLCHTSPASSAVNHCSVSSCFCMYPRNTCLCSECRNLVVWCAACISPSNWRGKKALTKKFPQCAGINYSKETVLTVYPPGPSGSHVLVQSTWSETKLWNRCQLWGSWSAPPHVWVGPTCPTLNTSQG